MGHGPCCFFYCNSMLITSVQQQRDINLLSLFLFLNRSHEERERTPSFLSRLNMKLSSPTESYDTGSPAVEQYGGHRWYAARSLGPPAEQTPRKDLWPTAPLFFSFRFLAAKSLWRGMRIILNHKLLLLSFFVCRFDRKDRSSSFRPF